MRRSLRHLSVAACVVLLLSRLPPAGAANAQLPSAASEYLIDVWQSDEGLPQNSVRTMAQTSDGYLWLETFGGVARFDGRRFAVFENDQFPELSGGVFTSLRADAQGNLWMRNDRNGVVVGRNGRFRKLGQADGLPPTGAVSLTAAPDGSIWISDGKGRLLQYGQGRFTVVKDTPPAPDWGRLGSFQIDPAGGVWAWNKDQCARLADGQWVMILQVPGPEGKIGTVRPFLDGSGAMLTRRKPDRLVRYWKGALSDLGPVPESISSYILAEDPTGDWWISKEGGILRLDPQGRWSELTHKDGFPPETLLSQALDREGNHWFGTDGGGLVRVKHRAVRAFGVAEGMSKKAALSLAGDRTNGIWVAALLGGLDHFNGSRFTPIEDAPELVWCVRPARNGGLWVGTYSDGLYRMDARGTQWQHFVSGRQTGMMRGPIFALFEASGGDLWMGGERGLSRDADGQFRSWTTTNGLADDLVSAIEEDRSGAIWIGTGAGLNRLAGETLQTYTVADGLAGKTVRTLFRDSEGDLWIGGRELTRFKDGRFSAIRTTNGLPVTGIKAIIEDDLGYLWFSTSHGILRASRRQLNEVCDTSKGQVAFSVFTKADGLPSNECSGYQPAVWKGSDGRLWFPTLNGLAVIDPKNLPENKVPPPVVIEAVVADDKPIALPQSPAAQVPIPAGTLRLDLRFAALSFTAPEKNRFRYRLEGFDADWIQAGTAQIASYTRPPPGAYRFHVCGCNNDGVWNQAGAALELAVLPLFWQTGWFRTTIVILTAGLIYWVYLTRLAQVERRRLVQEAFARQVIDTQEAERQRIAHELHDGVGQILLLVKNRLSLGIRKMGTSSPLAEHFGQAATDVSQAIEEIRATAHALRPVELDRLGLGTALQSMLERAAGTTTTKISTELGEVKGLVGREVEIQLFRIAQEATNNVLKHSKAGEVNVSLQREGKELRLTVQDDGVGFDPALPGGKRGFGLSGMAERARLIGGVLSVLAAPGKGCRLTVTVPLLKERHE